MQHQMLKQNSTLSCQKEPIFLCLHCNLFILDFSKYKHPQLFKEFNKHTLLHFLEDKIHFQILHSLSTGKRYINRCKIQKLCGLFSLQLTKLNSSINILVNLRNAFLGQYSQASVAFIFMSPSTISSWFALSRYLSNPGVNDS